MTKFLCTFFYFFIILPCILYIFLFSGNVDNGDVIGLLGTGSETANEFIDRLVIYRLRACLQFFLQEVESHGLVLRINGFTDTIGIEDDLLAMVKRSGLLGEVIIAIQT